MVVFAYYFAIIMLLYPLLVEYKGVLDSSKSMYHAGRRKRFRPHNIYIFDQDH